jgi:hypothetical protein
MHEVLVFLKVTARHMVRQAHHEGEAVEKLGLILSLSKDEPQPRAC